MQLCLTGWDKKTRAWSSMPGRSLCYHKVSNLKQRVQRMQTITTSMMYICIPLAARRWIFPYYSTPIIHNDLTLSLGGDLVGWFVWVCSKSISTYSIGHLSNNERDRACGLMGIIKMKRAFVAWELTKPDRDRPSFSSPSPPSPSPHHHLTSAS